MNHSMQMAFARVCVCRRRWRIQQQVTSSNCFKLPQRPFLTTLPPFVLLSHANQCGVCIYFGKGYNR